MNDTRVKPLTKDEIKEMLLEESGMLKIAKAFCRGKLAKGRLFDMGIDINLLEDVLDENEEINADLNEVIDRLTEQRYYRNAQIGIANITKILVNDIDNPETVKMCKEALQALDSVKKGCRRADEGKAKKSAFAEFQEAMKALGG